MPDSTKANERVREQARRQVQDLNGFDFYAPAELFPSPSKRRTGSVRYKRFDTAAEALQFAMEQLPPAALAGAYLEVEEARFDVHEMRSLYESAAYPLKRSGSAAQAARDAE